MNQPGTICPGSVRGDVSDRFAIPSGELIARYQGRGPRYTSYPPVPAWQNGVDKSGWADALRSIATADDPIAVYVHVPFCRRRCWYCACNVVISRSDLLAEQWLDTLESELKTTVSFLGRSRPVSSLHLGGGTPNALTREQLGRLMELLERYFHFTPDAERALEVDPRIALDGDLAFFATLGFSRVSFGVQDADDEVGAAIGRITPLSRVAELAAQARAAGFTSVNADLIYGLPKQTPESVSDGIGRILAEMNPDRVALYGYAHVPDLRPQQRRLEKSGLPGPDERIAIFCAAVGRLMQGGLDAVGMDHFARPTDPLLVARDDGTLARGFQGYSTVTAPDLIGFGPSAISYLTSLPQPVYAQASPILKRWHEDPMERPRTHRLTPEELATSATIQDLMCRLRAEGQPSLPDLSDFERDGIVKMTTDGMEVTPLGRHFLRQIAMRFDGAVPAHTYSQTI